MAAKPVLISDQTNQKMAAKAHIAYKETIKPSSTPCNLRDFKLSFLDQLAPNIYVPVLLFYSASDVTSLCASFSTFSNKLKATLSNVLSFYYPFCGRIKGNAGVECNDKGVLYVEARVPFRLVEILEDPQPQVNMLKQLLPFDPYEPGVDHDQEPVNMAIQVSEFSCGSLGLGVCISHKIADAATLASFLISWSRIAKGCDITTKPYMEASSLFPARDADFGTLHFDNKDIETRRLVFDRTNLSRLKDYIKGCNPTRVVAVTSLIWKSALEAARESSGEQMFVASTVSHIVNIRSLMVPPMPMQSIGNLYLPTTSPLFELEMDKQVELMDLAIMVRKAIKKVDIEYVSKLKGDGGFDIAMESYGQMQLRLFGTSNNVQGYGFSSWVGFPFYEVDFGWGKPTWVCHIVPPIRNFTFLIPTRCGEGIEAWVNLTKKDMVKFERDAELQQYSSLHRVHDISIGE